MDFRLAIIRNVLLVWSNESGGLWLGSIRRGFKFPMKDICIPENKIN